MKHLLLTFPVYREVLPFAIRNSNAHTQTIDVEITLHLRAERLNLTVDVPLFDDSTLCRRHWEHCKDHASDFVRV